MRAPRPERALGCSPGPGGCRLVAPYVPDTEEDGIPRWRGTPSRRWGAGGPSGWLWAVPERAAGSETPAEAPQDGKGQGGYPGSRADGNSAAAVANTWLRSGARSAAPPPGRVPGTARGPGCARPSGSPRSRSGGARWALPWPGGILPAGSFRTS